ncbi:MAG TPA: polysaccharide deacetylase family protein [Kofleriaceae bacterium]|nr:polysaccharide deacetylase family protein [Kofleriaceae bacterium]
MYRWLGGLVTAALVIAARAEPSASAPAGHAPAARAADPLPPEAAATGAAPKTVAIATGAARPGLDARSLRSLTDDPVVGKADRIDGDETQGVVAFTFDDGPNPETTPAVIDALQKYDVPATFFIVTQRIAGKHGEKGREILHRELEAGFMVGSHSVTHPNLKHATPDKLAREIDASIRALAVEAQRPIGMFRPPYGAISGSGRARLARLGLTEVLWSVDTLDWRAHNPERLRKKVISMIKKDGGGVVLMHDVKPITAQVVAEVLDDLEAENCARIADKREPIVPVSLHYFIKDGKTPRALPEAVKRRTLAYKNALPERCAHRPPPPTPEPAAPRHAAK